MFLPAAIISFPDAADFWASTSEWAGPVWDTLEPPMQLILGVIIVVFIVSFIIRSLK